MVTDWLSPLMPGLQHRYSVIWPSFTGLLLLVMNALFSQISAFCSSRSGTSRFFLSIQPTGIGFIKTESEESPAIAFWFPCSGLTSTTTGMPRCCPVSTTCWPDCLLAVSSLCLIQHVLGRFILCNILGWIPAESSVNPNESDGSLRGFSMRHPVRIQQGMAAAPSSGLESSSQAVEETSRALWGAPRSTLRVGSRSAEW